MSTLILVHGIPGSGKSTLAKQLTKDLHPSNFVILSTDSLFNTLSESFSDSTYLISELHYHYLWTPDGLSHAHKLNQLKCQQAISKRIPLIVIDNTNLRFEHCEPYLKMAWDATPKYDMFFKEPETSWKDDVQECFKRCSHDVPLETIVRMNENRHNPKEMIDYFLEKYCK